MRRADSPGIARVRGHQFFSFICSVLLMLLCFYFDIAILVRLEEAQDPVRIGQESLELGDGKDHPAVELPRQVQLNFVVLHVEGAAEAQGRHDRFELRTHGYPHNLLGLQFHGHPVQELLDPGLQFG